MKIVLHRANTRGGGNHGWLTTRHSFSFADWYDPTRMGFGKLRVINDDVIAGSAGFGAHSHSNMEIITIVTSGTVTHTDSMGNKFEVPAGDVQVMSAGIGITHSEENASQDESLSLFQIWIETNKQNSKPNYAQKAFHLAKSALGITLLVNESGQDGALPIQQDAYISYVAVDGTNPISYSLRSQQHGIYIFVIEGDVSVVGTELGARDGLGLNDIDSISFSSKSGSSLILIEVPMH